MRCQEGVIQFSSAHCCSLQKLIVTLIEMKISQCGISREHVCISSVLRTGMDGGWWPALDSYTLAPHTAIGLRIGSCRDRHTGPSHRNVWGALKQNKSKHINKQTNRVEPFLFFPYVRQLGNLTQDGDIVL